MAQVVEHVLGKDEVTGSNPVSSSKNPVLARERDFYFCCSVAVFPLLCYNFLKGGDILKKLLIAVIILSTLVLVGCRQNNPFQNNEIINEVESSGIAEAKSEFTYSPVPNYSTEDVTLVHFTDTVKRGLKAEIAIKGEPNTFYTIRVIYSSGASQSKNLKPRNSDENGYVAWKWTVGAKTKVGEYPVEIYLNDTCKLKTTLTVTDE